MKWYEPTYLTVLAISLINWLMQSIDLMSKFSALIIGTMTIVYLYHKVKGQILDNKIKKKELNA